MSYIAEQILVCVCVHDRINNARRWIEIFKQCEKPANAKLCIIHNYDGEGPTFQWKELKGADYIIFRPNGGFDVGTMQDFLKGRLTDEHGGVCLHWDTLVWATDDTFPMRPDFLHVFLNAMQEDSVGAVGIEVSHMVKFHLRTNLYMLKRSIAEQLTFPCDPVPGKAESYQFEHACDTHGLTNQLRRMGLSVVQADPDVNGLGWDTHHHAGQVKWRNFFKVWPTVKPLGREAK